MCSWSCHCFFCCALHSLTATFQHSFWKYILEIVDKGGEASGKPFWNNLNSREKEKKADAEDKEQVDDSDMLHCSTVGCTKSYQTTRWLIEHEIKGKHQFEVKKQSMTDRAIDIFNDLSKTREAARIAVTEQVEAVREKQGPKQEHNRGWALKSSGTNRGIDQKAKELAEKYFQKQRSLVPARRADASFMRKQLEDAKDPSDRTGQRYLLAFEKIPSEKQLTALFLRLERLERIAKPKGSAVKKTRTSTTSMDNKNRRITRSKSSVASTSGSKRKMKVVESSESEMDDDVFEEEMNEDEHDDEIEREHEEDFINRIIEEESAEIFM